MNETLLPGVTYGQSFSFGFRAIVHPDTWHRYGDLFHLLEIPHRGAGSSNGWRPLRRYLTPAELGLDSDV